MHSNKLDEIQFVASSIKSDADSIRSSAEDLNEWHIVARAERILSLAEWFDDTAKTERYFRDYLDRQKTEMRTKNQQITDSLYGIPGNCTSEADASELLSGVVSRLGYAALSDEGLAALAAAHTDRDERPR